MDSWIPKFLQHKTEPELSQQEKNAMDTWVFSETSVTVQCREYIAIIIIICSAILFGGIAIPFAVRKRITGVDPFQITNFTWLIIGSILILAKGRYVNEWPWHDFIHGCVVCRKVSDLAGVTGVRAQTVLAKLLHNERQTTLITRGPYNGMFLRKADHSALGFSIDVPVHSRTMFLSGFTIFKIRGDLGNISSSWIPEKGQRPATHVRVV